MVFEMELLSFSQRGFSRRNFLKQAVSGAGALIVGGALIAGGVSSVSAKAGPEPYVTSADLNLRSQPNLSASVLLVIPAGGMVGYLEEDQNGFSKVSYAGSIGWAKSDYLSPANSGDGSGNYDAPYRGQATTSSSVNMRSGGGFDYGVIQVLPAGAVVDVHDDYANYFWLVNYNGTFGWVHSDYLIMGDGGGSSDTPQYTGQGVTTATVNLRAGQGTGYAVLDVVPEGAEVELFAGPAGSWARVRYNNQFGYIHSDYIAGM
jgi:N-acetylmuramoyl-L-alanine amidase